MKAVVMAGGEGTRLRPLTCSVPKPMVPLLNAPLMEYSIGLLKAHGIVEIFVTLHYLPNMVSEYFMDGSRFGVMMEYLIEKKPMGTAGSVKQAHQHLKDTFIVISGDALTDIDLSAAAESHRKNGAVATLVLKREPMPPEYGVVITDEAGRVKRFLEKPAWGEVFSDTVNTGIYILEPEVLSVFSAVETKDLSKEVFASLLKKGAPVYGYIAD
ncbi:MAG: nucleotidyltransferase family protein, partial [Bacillota bacterium]|nr:nucleotidyltransferase family protein [Bacillota bacterium]